MTIRPARRDDLAAAAAIYADNESEATTRYHPLLQEPDDPEATTRAALDDLFLLHDEDPVQVWVAVRNDVIGFAAAAIRGHHWHLTYLFVDKDARERGVGGELLRAIHEAGAAAGCTAFSLQASDDPRALTHYFRLGLVPQPFSVLWGTSAPRFPTASLSNPLQATAITAGDDAILNTIDDIDKAVRGVRRRPDIERWLRDGAQGALLTDRATGKPVGYYLVGVENDDGRIGPVASLDIERFRDVFAAALIAAGTLHRPSVNWVIVAPGENWTAIAPILDAGFRPRWCDAFFASAPIGCWQSYLCHDLDLL
ncbi:MAG: GNAT family N-acetyltransferase [Thermomicrobiales bacterium]